VSEKGHQAMSLPEVTRLARASLADGGGALVVIRVPSGSIIASSPAAAALLDPAGGEVEGRLLEEFTSDEPSGALALFAAGRIDGFEASRSFARRGEPDLQVSLWHRRFDQQPRSRFALVLMTTDTAHRPEIERHHESENAPVVGAVSRMGLIEQISGRAAALFGRPPDRILGTPVSALVDRADAAKWRTATSEASGGSHNVTVLVRARGTAEPERNSSAAIACEVLLLPLRPGFIFVFLPRTEGVTHPLDAAGMRAMLTDLSRVAGIAQAERQKISGLTERDLAGIGGLTSREREMLTRLVAGYRVSGIAADFVLSTSTVRTHLASIFAKLGVSSQSELLDAVRSSRPDLAWGTLDQVWHNEASTSR
jgi:DNA-binding CsgD family transcriptional regulator/PAS domain-containing protein